MKDGKLELFDDVMTKRGKGQIRFIEDDDDKDCVWVVNDAENWRAWFSASNLTYIPKQPVMVYVSDESEEDAIFKKRKEELLIDFGDRFPEDYRYITTMGLEGSWCGWHFAVPVDSIPVPKPTITKAEVQRMQDLLEKVKNGAVVIEGEE